MRIFQIPFLGILLPVIACGQITVDTLAGGPFHDGPLLEAKFHSPANITVGADGTIYIVDTYTSQIRKITGQIVSTLAGSGLSAFADGAGKQAHFWFPEGVTTDASGNVYIADRGNRRIRKISPEGVVTTLAGSGDVYYADGVGVTAAFNDPSDVAVDADGNVYVTDRGNHRIRKITPAGVVSTFAGTGLNGYLDGAGDQAEFTFPQYICIDLEGNLYVTESQSHCIRKITPTGVVSTLAGSTSQFGFKNDTGGLARFSSPSGLCADSNGNIYVADRSNARIRKVSPAGVVTTFSGSGTSGYIDGASVTARFGFITDVCFDEQGNILAVDGGNYVIRKITADGTVSTLAGSPPYEYANGKGSIASFKAPYGVAVDSQGNVFVADRDNHRIRRISPGGVVFNYAGTGQIGSLDGSSGIASFSRPTDVEVDSSGTVYVADSQNHKIRKITTDGIVSTVAGSSTGFVNGNTSQAKFNLPTGLSILSDGTILVADRGNHSIRKINTNGTVETVAGTGSSGSTNGAASTAKFNSPNDVASNSLNIIFVADTDNNMVRRISAEGTVSTFAGNSLGFGLINGTGTTATFNRPTSIVVDKYDNIFVADRDYRAIRKITPTASVTTYAGRTHGYYDGAATIARFGMPNGIAIADDGSIYVADYDKPSIRIITSVPPVAPQSDGILRANFSYKKINSQQISFSGSPRPTFTANPSSIPTGLTLASAGLISGIATQHGPFSGDIVIENYKGTITVPFIFSVHDSDYLSWMLPLFGSEQALDPTISAPQADPDNDGRANLLEYAAGTSPTAPNAEPATKLVFQGNKLYFQFERTASIATLDHIVETSDDLKTWTPVPVSFIQTADDIIQVESPQTLSPSIFFRLTLQFAE